MNATGRVEIEVEKEMENRDRAKHKDGGGNEHSQIKIEIWQITYYSTQPICKTLSKFNALHRKH